jgi:hypothetical protein
MLLLASDIDVYSSDSTRSASCWQNLNEIVQLARRYRKDPAE